MLTNFCKFIFKRSLNYRFIHTSSSKLQTQPLITEALPNRKLIKVSGAESSSFLQGLLTADVNLLENGENEDVDRSLYSMMLNIQGRILYDVFVYRIEKLFKEDSSLLLECEEGLVKEIVKYMKIYKIRKKLKFTMLDELSVWVVMKDLKEPSEKHLNPSFSKNNQVLFLKADPRLPWLAHRMLLPANLKASEVLQNTTEVSGEYRGLRYTHGVSEGPSDLPSSTSLPLEANLHFLNGVSFSKGCYIGQELTARTHHTGVIRKRIMPLSSKEDLNLDLTKDDLRVISTTTNKEVGRLRAWQGRRGLGLLRLQETLLNTGSLVLKKAPVPKQGKGAGDEKGSGEVLGEVTTSIPVWWPLDEDEIIKKTLAKMKSS